MFAFFWLTHESWKTFWIAPCLSVGPVGSAMLSLWHWGLVGATEKQKLFSWPAITCQSAFFSPVLLFHLLFPGYATLSLTLLTCLCCRTLAPSRPHKRRRLLQPEVAHRRYRLHFCFADFLDCLLGECLFSRSCLFFQRTIWPEVKKKQKTGRVKQLSNPAFPNLSGLQQYYTAMTRHYSLKNRKLIFLFSFFEWDREKSQEGALMHLL